MGFYKTPADMFEARAKRCDKEGRIHWKQAKAGEGDFHYGKAKKCFEESRNNQNKAEDALKNGLTFTKKE